MKGGHSKWNHAGFQTTCICMSCWKPPKEIQNRQEQHRHPKVWKCTYQRKQRWQSQSKRPSRFQANHAPNTVPPPLKEDQRCPSKKRCPKQSFHHDASNRIKVANDVPKSPEKSAVKYSTLLPNRYPTTQTFHGLKGLGSNLP